MQSLKAIYKVGRWVVLVVLIAAGVLMLRRPQPAAAELAPALQAEKAKEFEQSLAKLEKSDQSDDSASTATEARFDTDQVNSFIAVASAEAAKQSPAGAQNAGAGTAQNASTDAGQYSPVSSSKVAFREDEVTAQAVTQRYGRDIYVTVRGHIGSKDGYVTFEPTEFSVGSLSVPVSLVNPTLQKMLRQPEVRDRLKLPAFISDLRVENSQLVIVRK